MSRQMLGIWYADRPYAYLHTADDVSFVS